MKLHQSQNQGNNLFTGYGDGHVLINHERHDGNLIVSPDRVAPWAAEDFAGLTAEHFAAALDFEPELVLFGSGASLRFPHPKLTADLARARIGVEAMDTAAACRTYNILLAEGRRVVALLLV